MTDVQTARLILRIPVDSDADALRVIHDDPESRKHVTIHDDPQARTHAAMSDSVSQAIAWRNVAMMIGHWHLRGCGEWVVIERLSGEVVGRVGFFCPPQWPSVELGWIVARSRQGRGFATEAAAAALEWAWSRTNITKVVSMIAPDNAASIRIAEKLGLHFERTEAIHGPTLRLYGIARPQTLGVTAEVAPLVDGGRAVAKFPEVPPAFAVNLDQPLGGAVDQLERAMVERALANTAGRVAEAAALLGLSRKGLFLKRRRWGLLSDQE